jgi:hypothetical protein
MTTKKKSSGKVAKKSTVKAARARVRAAKECGLVPIVPRSDASRLWEDRLAEGYFEGADDDHGSPLADAIARASRL